MWNNLTNNSDITVIELTHLLGPIGIYIWECKPDETAIKSVEYISHRHLDFRLIADYLNYAKISTANILEMPKKVEAITHRGKILNKNLSDLAEYIDRLTGEMAYQLAFPNKSPRWRPAYLGIIK